MVRDNVREIATLSQAVADRIRVELARQKISGRELARLMEVSPGWVNDRMTGKTVITVNDAQAFADALGIRLGPLLGVEPRTMIPLLEEIQKLVDEAPTALDRRRLVTIVNHAKEMYLEFLGGTPGPAATKRGR